MGTLFLKLLMADDKENKTVPEQEQGQSGWLTTRKLELAFAMYIIHVYYLFHARRRKKC